MIIYQGKGCYIYLIPICIFILSALILDKENWSFYACFVTAILELVVAYISYKEHKGNPYRYLDKLTGEEILIEHKNTLYWIKAEYWGVFIAATLLLKARSF